MGESPIPASLQFLNTTESSLQKLLLFSVECARLAPTGHNCQPYRFQLGPDYVDVWTDPSRILPVIDPDEREMTMSCGVALFFLRLAFRYRGRCETVEIRPDPLTPHWMARVRLGETTSKNEDDSRLFHAMRRRHTNRLPFFPGAVPDGLPERLIRAAEQEGGCLQVIGTKSERAATARLVGEGVHAQSGSVAFQKEMDGWSPRLRKNGTGDIFHHSAEMRGILTHGDMVVTTLNGGEFLARREQLLATEAPLLVMLGTVGDTYHDWLNAGQALARVLLLAAASGVNATYLNHPIQVEHLRPLLQEAIRMQAHPQLLLAMGYAPAVSTATSRRPLEEILVEA